MFKHWGLNRNKAKGLRLSSFQKKLVFFISLGLAGSYAASTISGTFGGLFFTGLLSESDAGGEILASQLYVGLLLSVPSLAIALLLPICGRISDSIKNLKWRRLIFIFVSLFCYLLSFPFMPLAFLSHNLGGLIASLYISSISNSVFCAFLTITMVDHVEAPLRGRFSGYCALFGYTGLLAGLLVANSFSYSSYLLSKDPWRLILPFIIALIILGVCALSLAFFLRKNALVELKGEGESEVSNHKKKSGLLPLPIILFFMAIGAAAIGGSSFSGFSASYFQYHLLTDTANLSRCSLISSLVSLVLFVPANFLAEKKGGKLILLSAYLLAILGYLWIFLIAPRGDQKVAEDGSIILLSSFPSSFYGAYFLLGCHAGLGNCDFPLFARYLKKGHEASYSNYFTAVSSLLSSLTPLLVGALLANGMVWGLLPLFSLVGFSCAFIFLLFLPKPKEKKNESLDNNCVNINKGENVNAR